MVEKNLFLQKVISKLILKTLPVDNLNCDERPRWRPRLFGMFARTSGKSSTNGDLGESGEGILKPV